MGDSTTDEIVEAVELWKRLRTVHTTAGQGLSGMSPANIVSYGHNGSKLADWWGNTAWKAEITGSAAHLLILSYGINDWRLGATTYAAFRALLIQVVDYLRAQMPNTDIVLRIPNSFTSDNTDVFAVGWLMPQPPRPHRSTAVSCVPSTCP